jgi:hypothetical protein
MPHAMPCNEDTAVTKHPVKCFGPTAQINNNSFFFYQHFAPTGQLVFNVIYIYKTVVRLFRLKLLKHCNAGRMLYQMLSNEDPARTDSWLQRIYFFIFLLIQLCVSFTSTGIVSFLPALNE